MHSAPARFSVLEDRILIEGPPGTDWYSACPLDSPGGRAIAARIGARQAAYFLVVLHKGSVRHIGKELEPSAWRAPARARRGEV